MSLTNLIGFIGVMITLIAYLCMSFRWMSAQGRIFFLMNTIGAALTCLSSYMMSFWPSVVLEGVWTLVSFIALLRVGKSRNKQGRGTGNG